MYKPLLVFLFFLTPLIGKIVEIHYFEEIKQYLEPDTLVILDIDNTLLMPIQEVGSDQWFCHRRDWYELQGYAAQDALEYALAEWEGIQNITQGKTPEVTTARLVNELQERFTVMGLTTRGLALATRTVHQLNELKIDLSKHSLTTEDVALINPQVILFRKGILFTAGTHKGKALRNLLDTVHFTPKRILFINDKASQLREVEVAYEEQKIPFIGLRYGFLDEKVKAFRADIARVQFERFRAILSDKEARYLIER